MSAFKEDLYFLAKIPTLARATVNNDAPVSGYLLEEITSITHESNGVYVNSVVDYLLGALEKEPLQVKLKVLKILLHIVTHGHPTVRKVLWKKDYSIKEAARLFASSDPIHGNVPVTSVREASKELLNLIFEDDIAVVSESSRQSTPSPASSTESKTFSGYGNVVSSGKYQGFGNTPIQQKTLTKQVTEGISNVVTKITRNTQEEAVKKEIDILGSAVPDYKAVSVPSVYVESNTTSAAPVKQPVSRPVTARKKGRAGGGWDDEDNDIEGNADFGSSSDKKGDDGNLDLFLLKKTSSISSDSLDRPESVPVVDWSEENKVVEEYAPASSTFPPTRKELVEVCKRCSTLNCDKILEFICKKLFAREENTQMRALVLAELLLHKDLVTLEGVVKIVLPCLQSLKDTSVDPVQIKAKKISLIVEKLSNDAQGMKTI